MDASGLSHFKQEYPSSTGGVRGGRATFRDTNGKGNTFLTCHEAARAYVYGAYYDEIDISRSHFTHLMGCWSRTGQPRPTTVLRYISEQEALEKDIERELQAGRPRGDASAGARVFGSRGAVACRVWSVAEESKGSRAAAWVDAC